MAWEPLGKLGTAWLLVPALWFAALPAAHALVQGLCLARRLTGGPWVLLLNPDVTVPDGFLDDVLASLDATTAADPAVGVVGFRLRNPDGTGQASSGPFPTLASTVRDGLVTPFDALRRADEEAEERVAGDRESA